MTNTLTATLSTTQGTIKVRLFPDQAPQTVRNFVELAEGTRKWTDPRSGAETSDRLYDGTVPPGDSRLHDSGRRSARHRDRRPGIQVR